MREQTDEYLRIVREFDEIRVSILTSTLTHIIAQQMNRLKSFLHKNSFLLRREDVAGFYHRWIAKHEIELWHGSVMNLHEEQYEQMLKELAEIDLRSLPET